MLVYVCAERERERETDRQTQTHRHTDTQTEDREKNRETDKQTDRGEREKNRDRQTDRQTDGQSASQTERDELMGGCLAGNCPQKLREKRMLPAHRPPSPHAHLPPQLLPPREDLRVALGNI